MCVVGQRLLVIIVASAGYWLFFFPGTLMTSALTYLLFLHTGEQWGNLLGTLVNPALGQFSGALRQGLLWRSG